VGYGNQGRTHALNLRDSGMRVVVGLRPGSPSEETVKSDGATPASIEEAARADIVSLLVPDEAHGQVYDSLLAPHMRPGTALCLAHGLSVRFGMLKPKADVDVFMVAPLGAGSLLRRLYAEGKGLPCYVAIHQDRSGRALETALAYAAGLGCVRAGILETTFKDEAEVDLFGEQAVLCGGIAFLLFRAFEVLVESGYEPRMAYMECVNQLKASADVINAVGLDGFADEVSSPALYGMLTRGERVVGQDTERAMRSLLEDIQSGKFVEDWLREGNRNKAKLLRLLAEWKSLRMQAVGRDVRKLTNPSDK
jgi:ketol-acid reductoisomerase